MIAMLPWRYYLISYLQKIELCIQITRKLVNDWRVLIWGARICILERIHLFFDDKVFPTSPLLPGLDNLTYEVRKDDIQLSNCFSECKCIRNENCFNTQNKKYISNVNIDLVIVVFHLISSMNKVFHIILKCFI